MHAHPFSRAWGYANRFFTTKWLHSLYLKFTGGWIYMNLHSITTAKAIITSFRIFDNGCERSRFWGASITWHMVVEMPLKWHEAKDNGLVCHWFNIAHQPFRLNLFWVLVWALLSGLLCLFHGNPSRHSARRSRHLLGHAYEFCHLSVFQ